MMIMKRLLCMLLLILCIAPARAEYAPVVKNALSEAENEAVATFRAMPQNMREAYFAEKLGLLYLPGGESGYKMSPHLHPRENGIKISSPLPFPQAMFMSSSGEEYEFSASSAQGDEQNISEIGRALSTLYAADEAAILQAFAKDITAMCTHTAKKCMASLATTAREALLAELANLVYKKSTSEFGSNKIRKEPTGLYKIGRSITRINRHIPGQKFINSAGKEVDFRQITQANEMDPAHKNAWELTLLISQYIGVEEVLALYPDKISAMRRFFDQRNK